MATLAALVLQEAAEREQRNGRGLIAATNGSGAGAETTSVPVVESTTGPESVFSVWWGTTPFYQDHRMREQRQETRKESTTSGVGGTPYFALCGGSRLVGSGCMFSGHTWLRSKKGGCFGSRRN